MVLKKLPITEHRLYKIAEEYGTPFYIYDQKGIEDNINNFKKSFSWCSNFYKYFAVKATPNPWILKLLHNMGIGADCSSMAELILAEAVGLKGKEIVFSSNNTADEEFIKANSLGAIINLDDISMFEDLERLKIIPEKISFRYNPGNKVSIGNNFIGKPEDAKYGMTKEQLLESVQIAKKLKIPFIGIHTMIVSSELTLDVLIANIRMLFELAIEIREKFNVIVDFIDFGGGIGIPYRPDDRAVNLFELGKRTHELFKSMMSGFEKTQLSFECGRAITGPYGYLVTKAIHHKNIYKKYIGVDACMADLMRPGIYGAYHEITICSKEDTNETEIYDIVGSLCENNDKFAINRKLPKISKGDLIVIHDTGAHGHSMGFNYNGKLRHQELLLHSDGTIQKIRRNETLNDLFSTLDFPGL